MKNRILALTLALSMSLCVPAFAAGNEITTSGGSGESVVELTAEAATFSVTVPTAMPISVAADGTVTVADNLQIVNESAGAVKVSGIDLTCIQSWGSEDYDTMDPTSMQVNMKRFAMEINGCKTTGYDAITFNASAFPVLSKTGATDNSDKLAITYNAKIAPQANAMTNFQVAQVTFIIGWNTAE